MMEPKSKTVPLLLQSVDPINEHLTGTSVGSPAVAGRQGDGREQIVDRATAGEERGVTLGTTSDSPPRPPPT